MHYNHQTKEIKTEVILEQHSLEAVTGTREEKKQTNIKIKIKIKEE